jgi:hypothetical protein
VNARGRSTWLRPEQVALLACACVVVLRTRLGLWFLPWRRIVAMAGHPRARAPRFTADRLARAVRLASRVVPHATCLTQALALNRLLSRDGHASTVQIGVRKDDSGFSAHAWVECMGAPLLSTDAEVTKYSRCLTWPAPITRV